MVQLNPVTKITEAIVPSTNLTNSDIDSESSSNQYNHEKFVDYTQANQRVLDQSNIDSTSEASTFQRPQRNRRPPDKLSMKWDASQSYV